MRTYCIKQGPLLSVLCGPMGRKSRNEGMCVYVEQIHFAVWKKLTQHYIETVLHKKLIKKDIEELPRSDSLREQ